MTIYGFWNASVFPVLKTKGHLELEIHDMILRVLHQADAGQMITLPYKTKELWYLFSCSILQFTSFWSKEGKI